MQSFAQNCTRLEAASAWRVVGSGAEVKSLRTGLKLALLVALACCPASHSRLGSGSGMGQSSRGQQVPGRQDMGPLDDPDNYDVVMAEKRLRALNTERQKQMVADAGKLLKLAKELNDEVAASNTGSLTPEQLRKIAEIEKLARSVKERMTAGGVQSQPALTAPSFAYPGP